MCSTYQTAVLVQYNDNDTLSLQELIDATALPREMILQVLAVLVKAKILINDNEEQYDLNPSELLKIHYLRNQADALIYRL